MSNISVAALLPSGQDASPFSLTDGSLPPYPENIANQRKATNDVQFFSSSLIAWLVFLAIVLTAARYGRAKERTKHDFDQCKATTKTASMKDPIFGFDFVWERFFTNVLPPGHLESCYRKFQEFGSTFDNSRWTMSMVETCDAVNIQAILASNFEDYSYPRVRSKVMSFYVGKGILTLDGESWKRSRSIVKPAFSKHNLESLQPVLDRHVNAFMERVLENKVNVDLQPLFSAMTMDVASEFIGGKPVGMLDSTTSTKKSNSPGMGLSSDDHDGFNADSMATSMETSFKMRLGPLSRFRSNADANAARDRTFEYCTTFIQASRASMGDSGEGKLNNESIASSLEEEEQPKKTFNLLQAISNSYRNDTDLRDQTMHLLLASRDTTSSLLSSLFFMLAKRPEIYARLRREIIDTIGDESPTFVQLKNITYLRHCVNESLRLHPPIPSNAREAIRDTVLPRGGGEDGQAPIMIPKGGLVLYNSYALHRNKEVYGEDSEDFRPERWEGLRPGWAFIPFSGGHKICLGQEMALFEAYYTVAVFARSVESITSETGSEWTELLGIATTCRNGVQVTLS